MAGLFESIGRTNALPQETTKLSDMILNMRKMDTDEANAAVARKTGELENRKLEYQVAELDKKKKDAETPIPLSALGDMLNTPEGPLLLNKAKAIGYIEKDAQTGAEFIRKENFGKMGEILNTDYKFGIELNKARYMAHNAELSKIETALQNPKLKPEEKQAMLQRKQQINSELAFVIRGNEELGKRAAQADELERIKFQEEEKRKTAAEEARLGIGTSAATSEIKNFKFLTSELGMDKAEAQTLSFSRKEMTPDEYARRVKLAALSKGKSEDEANMLALKALESDLSMADANPEEVGGFIDAQDRKMKINALKARMKDPELTEDERYAAAKELNQFVRTKPAASGGKGAAGVKLPDASKYDDKTVIRDKKTGVQYINVGGKSWKQVK